MTPTASKPQTVPLFEPPTRRVLVGVATALIAGVVFGIANYVKDVQAEAIAARAEAAAVRNDLGSHLIETTAYRKATSEMMLDILCSPGIRPDDRRCRQ